MTEPTEPAATAPHVIRAVHAVMCDVIEVRKDRRTTGGTIYNFRGVDDVVNAVGPALREHMLIMSPSVLHLERREYRAGKEGKTVMTETLVKMTFTFTSAVDGSTHKVGPVWGESADSGDKSATKSQSVAERVALLQALCIPTDAPDPDETVVENQGPPLATREQTDEIFAHLQAYEPIDERRMAKREFKQTFGDLAELPADKVDAAWTWLVNRDLALAGVEEDPEISEEAAEANRVAGERTLPPGVDPETGELQDEEPF